MSFLDKLKAVLTQEGARFIREPIELQESGKGSTCKKTKVEGAAFAIRVQGNDHLKFLRGAPEQPDGYCNLPDYFLFSELRRTKKRDYPIVQVMLVEMKSSRPSDLALRQLQLGVAVLPYLVALARLDSGADRPFMEMQACGVLLWPISVPRGGIAINGANYVWQSDAKVGIPIYPEVPCGPDLDMHHFEYRPACIGGIVVS